MPETLPSTPTGDEWLDELLKNGSIPPSRCYGERDKLRLDAMASAFYVGCDLSTIYSAVAIGDLKAFPDKSNDPDCPLKHIRTFLLAELQPMRQRWQQHDDGTRRRKESLWRSKKSQRKRGCPL